MQIEFLEEYQCRIKRRITKAIKFAADYYNIDCDLEVLISEPDGDMRGAADFDHDEYEGFIVIYTLEDVEETVFHEMTHIKQYMYNGLTMENGIACFKGKTYDYSGTDADNYLEVPWEVEAYEMEVHLFNLYSR